MSTNENKAIVLRFFNEACNQRNQEVISQVFAESFLNNGIRVTPETVRNYVNNLWLTFEKVEVNVDIQITEEDRVSTVRTWRGSQKGKEIEWKQISVVRLENGKIVDDWVVEEDWKSKLESPLTPASILHIPANNFSDKLRDKSEVCGRVTSDDSDLLPKSPHLRAAYVKFENGSYTKLHRHLGEQLLLVTEGIGFVEQQDQQRIEIKVGDRIYIPANVWHRHGALKGENMVHLAITIGITKWDKDDPCD